MASTGAYIGCTMTGSELKAMREAAGFSRTQLADAIGRSLRMIYRWEVDGERITVTNQIAIKSVLGTHGAQRAPKAARKASK